VRSVSKLVLRTIAGGVWGALIFLGLGSLKELLVMLPEDFTIPGGLFLILIILLMGAFSFFWLGGDFILIAALMGAQVAFVKNLRRYIDVEEKVYWAMLLCTGILALLAVYAKLETISQIEPTYSRFCSSVSKGDYHSAYDFFTPEYQSQTDFKQFVNKLNDRSAYVTGCNLNEGSMKFVSSFVNTGSVFPYRTDTIVAPLLTFLPGPELRMQKINGEWLFTGEEKWYLLH
jgi:hypothetical protein